MRTARRYLVGGRVQGVGFRWFTKDCADRDGVDGWVRNLPDGRVEIEAEADTGALMQFEREIRHGPAGARVDGVDVVEIPASPARIGFQMRRG